MRLKYEPASVPQHISVKRLFLNALLNALAHPSRQSAKKLAAELTARVRQKEEHPTARVRRTSLSVTLPIRPAASHHGHSLAARVDSSLQVAGGTR